MTITERSIFFRIYAGLLLVCLVVAFFGYFLMQTINQQRLQSYRESIATMAFYLGTSSFERQKSEKDKQYWLQKTSQSFDASFKLQPVDTLDFTGRELKRLQEGKSVIRYNTLNRHSTIYHKVNDGQDVLLVDLGSIGERQIHATMDFVSDDLRQYKKQVDKEERLNYLNSRLEYPITLISIEQIRLDRDQYQKLISKELVLDFNNADNQNPHVSVMMMSDTKDQVMVVGPIPLFNFFSLDIIASVVLICLLLMSFGVYGLIFPLERRLQLLQMGVDKVAQGDLNTMVQVAGYDDIARLSSTFNGMTRHIKRLIESQRELTRAVSHELRTPVARIRFAVDMLADEDDKVARQTQKQYIDEDIESLNELIDEILTYAKLEEGSPQMNWEMVNLEELLEQIQRETKALGKPIDIKIALPTTKNIAKF